jgi:asparagine synthase (glutamine-hydrolysing)
MGSSIDRQGDPTQERPNRAPVRRCDGVVGLGAGRSVVDAWVARAGGKAVTRAGGGSAAMVGGTFLEASGGWVVAHSAGPAPVDSSLLAAVVAAGPAAAARTVPDALALVVWDADRAVLSLARTTGASPRLFVRVDDDAVYWSTSPDGLIRPGDRVDPARVASFLANGHVGFRATLVEGIRQLGPGEVWEVDRSGTRVDHLPAAWDVPVWPAGRPGGGAVVAEAFGAAMERSMVGVSSPGILLSGGIDSVAVAVGLGALVGARPVAFTVRVPGHPSRFDEFAAAAETASALGLDHEPVDVGPEWIEDRLDWMVEHYAEPFSVAVHTSNLGGLVDAGCDTLFTGAGGDSWALTKAARRGTALSRVLPERLASAVVSGLGRVPVHFKGKAHLRKVFRYAGDLGVAILADPVVGTPVAVRTSLLGDDVDAQARSHDLAYLVERAGSLVALPRPQRTKYLWGFVSEPDYNTAWVLRWAGVHGLATRAPLLDVELSRVLAGATDPLRDRGELRDLAARHVPVSAAHRPKVGQSLPMAEWLRGPLRGLLEEHLTADRVGADGLVDPDAVRGLVAAHLSGAADHAWDLFKLVTLSRWKQRVFDPVAAAGAGPLGGSGR